MTKRNYCYEYPRASITTDIILFGYQDTTLSIKDRALSILLIERKNDPHKGKWAFPGGFLDMDETAEECAARELFEETSVSGVELEQIHTVSTVDRDPRGRTVSILFMGVVKQSDVVPIAADDAAKAQWIPLTELPPLAFDHESLLPLALNRL